MGYPLATCSSPLSDAVFKRTSQAAVAFAYRGIKRVDERIDGCAISFIRHESRLALFLPASCKAD